MVTKICKYKDSCGHHGHSYTRHAVYSYRFRLSAIHTLFSLLSLVKEYLGHFSRRYHINLANYRQYFLLSCYLYSNHDSKQPGITKQPKNNTLISFLLKITREIGISSNVLTIN